MAFRCIFCDSDSEPSLEHIISEWISKEIERQIGKGEKFWMTRDGDFNLTRRFESDKFEYKAKVVCRSCNHGWMEGLEVQVMPILPTLIAGDTRVLTPTEQGHLASWVVMKAMVAEHMQPRTERRFFFPDEARRFRRTKTPSSNTTVLLGFYFLPNQAFPWTRHLAPEWQGFLFAMVIRHLLIFALFGHGPELRAGGDPLMTTQVWPTAGHGIEWISPKVFHDPDLDRWWFSDPVALAVDEDMR